MIGMSGLEKIGYCSTRYTEKRVEESQNVFGGGGGGGSNSILVVVRRVELKK